MREPDQSLPDLPSESSSFPIGEYAFSSLAAKPSKNQKLLLQELNILPIVHSP